MPILFPPTADQRTRRAGTNSRWQLVGAALRRDSRLHHRGVKPLLHSEPGLLAPSLRQWPKYQYRLAAVPILFPPTTDRRTRRADR